MEGHAVSFSGCGFLGIYHVGAASCIKQYAPFLCRNKVAGASAGALVGCVLICNCCLGQCTSYVLRLAAKARLRALGPLHPDFDLINHLRRALNEILPVDAHLRCNGRLFVSVTRVSDGENVLLSNFPTREHLIQALLCSTFIPLYSGVTPPTFDGIAYVDGAFSNNLPKFSSGATVTVCPFAGESDICPRDQQSSHSMLLTIAPAGTPFLMTDVNINRLSQVLFPPPPLELAKICQDGFRDALRFLSLAGYINKLPDIIQLRACVTSGKTQSVSRVGGRSSAVTSDDDSGSDSYVQHIGRRNSLESSMSFRARRRRMSSANYGDTPTPYPSSPLAGTTSLPGTSSSKRRPNELHFLPPTARREFAEHLADSQGLLYLVFQSKMYRICSVLASPLYLPGEVCLRLMSKVYRYCRSCANSVVHGTVSRVYRILDYFHSIAVYYSPIVITSQPDGRLICSLDVVADRITTETAEHFFRRKSKVSSQRQEAETAQRDAQRTSNTTASYPTSPQTARAPHLVHLHLNAASDEPEAVRRLTHGPIDSKAATACLDSLLMRSSSVDAVDSSEINEEEAAFFEHVRKSNTEDNSATIEQLVGGKPSHAPPLLSYYYPDRQTDQLLVWELKEIDSEAND